MKNYPIETPALAGQKVLYTAREASEYLGFSVRALETMRHRGTGPAWRRFGKKILYHIDDLRAFADGLTSCQNRA